MALSIVPTMPGNRGRERGSDMQQRDPGWESNPGPLLHRIGALPTELNGAPTCTVLTANNA